MSSMEFLREIRRTLKRGVRGHQMKRARLAAGPPSSTMESRSGLLRHLTVMMGVGADLTLGLDLGGLVLFLHGAGGGLGIGLHGRIGGLDIGLGGGPRGGGRG